MVEDTSESLQSQPLQEALNRFITSTSVSQDIQYFIQYELEKGVLPNPWYDHVLLHTVNDTGSKVPIGFIQDAEGVMRTIYSDSSVYKSPRNIEGSIFGSWNAFKNATVSPLICAEMDDVSVVPGANIEYLPAEIGDWLHDGYILIKSDASKPTAFALQTVSVLNSGDRVGVLLDGQQTKIPWVIQTDSGDLIIEAKGIGLPEGGFGRLMERGNHESIEGGMLRGMSLHEQANLRQRERDVCVITFKNSHIPARRGFSSMPFTVAFDGQQGIVFRMVDSTVRVSFVDNEVFLENNKSHDRLKIHHLCRLLIEDLFQGRIHNSPHEENLSVSHDGLKMADYSDYYELADLPYNNEAVLGNVEGVEPLIQQYFTEMMNLTSKDPDRFESIKASLLISLYRIHNEAPPYAGELFAAENARELGSIVWKYIGAPAQFRSKLEYISTENSVAEVIADRYVSHVFRNQWDKDFHGTNYPFFNVFCEYGLIDCYVAENILIIDTAVDSGMLSAAEKQKAQQVKERLLAFKWRLYPYKTSADEIHEIDSDKFDFRPFYDASVDPQELRRAFTMELNTLWKI